MALRVRNPSVWISGLVAQMAGRGDGDLQQIMQHSLEGCDIGEGDVARQHHGD